MRFPVLQQLPARIAEVSDCGNAKLLTSYRLPSITMPDLIASVRDANTCASA